MMRILFVRPKNASKWHVCNNIEETFCGSPLFEENGKPELIGHVEDAQDVCRQCRELVTDAYSKIYWSDVD